MTLFNKNRVLVFILLLTGVLVDGVQLQDYFFIPATVLWLWLPQFVSAEASMLRKVGPKHGR